MATSFYDVGSVTLTNGSAVVTGVGTLWQTALITNGFVAVEAPGNLLPILTVDSDSQITAELEWTGLTGSYDYAILRQTDQMQDNAENSRALAYVISEIRNGTLFKYDAAGDLAGRALYDERPKGFSYLVFAGTSAQLYVKASATSGDWAGPFAYGRGDTGEMGPAGFTNFRGTYAAGTTYLRNDGVYHNGSSWVALQTTTGNAPPNLPTTSNAYWSLLAVKGQDGTGIGDMLASVYDPQNLQADAFDRGSHTGDLPDTVSLIDGTKKGRFDVGAVTAGQSRVYTMPDRDLVIDPLWERAGVIDLAGLSYASFPNLSQYRMLRYRVAAMPVANMGIPFLRVSQDNGATFNAGASEYNSTGFGVDGTAIGAEPASPSSYLKMSGALGANVVEIQGGLTEFNKLESTIHHSNASIFNASFVHAKQEYWGYRSGLLAHNALLFGTTSGLAFTSGIAILEGVRG